MPDPPAYAFGPYRLIPARRLLLRDDLPVPLPSKAFDTLVALIDRRDRVVTKDELMGLLWADVAVEEANLTQQIFLLRKAIGDAPEGGSYITTVARHGYRFSGDVKVLSELPAPLEPRVTVLRSAVLLAILAGIGMTGWMVFHAQAGRTAVLPVAATVEPPEGLALTNSIALSPDGRTLAFTASAPDGRGGLWVRAVGALESRALPGTDGARYPFWSPDSRWIGFFAGNQLRRIQAAAGPPEVIAPANGLGGSWNQYNQIVFGDGVEGLWCVSADGGQPTPCTALDPARVETGHRWPHFLPDGRHIVFMTRSNRAQGRLALAIAAIGDPPRRHRTLVQADTGAVFMDGHLLYVRGRVLWAQPFDPRRLEFSGPPVAVIADVWRSWGWEGLHGCTAARSRLIACRRGESDTRLMWVDRTGRDLGFAGPTRAASPELSPDGTRFLFARVSDGIPDSLWVANRDGSNAVPLTREGINVESYVWSPDGTRVAFASEQSGHFDLYEMSLANPEQPRSLLSSANFKFVYDWSRDGRWLLYRETNRTKDDVRGLRIDAAPGPDVRDVLRTSADENQPRLDPSGRWLAYTSTLAGRREVFAHAFNAPGPMIPISTAGGVAPRWRADGKELYFVAPDRRLMAVSVTWFDGTPEFGEPKRLFDRAIAAEYDYDYCPDQTGEHFLVNTLLTRGTITLLADWRGRPPL